MIILFGNRIELFATRPLRELRGLFMGVACRREEHP